MATLTLARPEVKSTTRPFGVGLVVPTTLDEARAWLADRTAAHEAEARTVDRRQIDRQWWLGFGLGRDGIEAYPAEGLTFVERKAFRDGWDAGMSELCEGLALDALEMSGMDAEDAEYHDMMSDAPAVPYGFN